MDYFQYCIDAIVGLYEIFLPLFVQLHIIEIFTSFVLVFVSYKFILSPIVNSSGSDGVKKSRNKDKE